jgi:hypothetical protein
MEWRKTTRHTFLEEVFAKCMRQRLKTEGLYDEGEQYVAAIKAGSRTTLRRQRRTRPVVSIDAAGTRRTYPSIHAAIRELGGFGTPAQIRGAYSRIYRAIDYKRQAFQMKWEWADAS